MISVTHLTKKYRRFKAVDDVSFEVERGEVVGFLGPNGAGKSTTMRILAGYLSATAGDVRIAGYDVRTHSMEVRRRIGYLPETAPLYPEMRVDEYLRYRARIKRAPVRRLSQLVAEAKERCGLHQMGREVIGRLSRGYRQRVALADVLVHGPELLILDEPTLGLDPDQNQQVRALIKELAYRHTILLCTHILPEVEMTCKRVLIINQGRIIAADTPDRLRTSLGSDQQVHLQIKAPTLQVHEQLTALPHIQDVQVKELEDGAWLHCVMTTSPEVDARSNLYDMTVRNGWPLRELSVQKRSLEDVYLDMVRSCGVRKGAGKL